MAYKIITIDEMVKSLTSMVKDSVQREMPDASEEEKEKAVREILQVICWNMNA